MKNFNINIKSILLFFTAILALGVIFYIFPNKHSSEKFQAEKTALEARITTNRKIREENRKAQEETYRAWKTQDAELESQINSDKEKLKAIEVLTGEKSSFLEFVPKASAQEIFSVSENFSEENSEKSNLKKIHEKICAIQPKSPLCTDFSLLQRLEKITADRIPDNQHIFPILLGITNSESSLGTNYAPHTGCSQYNNLGGVKWRKNDDGSTQKDQKIPQSDGCWLYRFDSLEDYWKSKVNTIRYGYAGCLADNPTTTLQCISRWYVRGNGIVKPDWVRNASVFLNF